MATQFLHSREIAAGQSTTKKTPLPHAAAPPMRLVLRTTVPGPKILDPDFNPQVCGFSFWPGGPEHYEWKALDEIIGKDVELFKEINPTDIRQGAVGDCWLISAFSCAAEFPQMVRKVFGEQEKIDTWMKVTLFDPSEGEWKTVRVRNEFPVRQGRNERLVHLFARPKGKEAWVLVLEKAVAKMLGGYDKIDGGFPSIAFRILTGKDPEEYWIGEIEGYGRLFIETHTDPVTWTVGFESKNFFTPDAMFLRLLEADKKNMLLAAGTYMDGPFGTLDDGIMKTEDGKSTGLFTAHAYSILQVKEVGRFKLLQMRNPHGPDGKEWKGAWGDFSPGWDWYPEIAEELGYKPTSRKDGLFWISYNEFLKYFMTCYLVPT